MKLKLFRRWFTDNSTLGDLYADDVWQCFTLEDKVRSPDEPKVPNQTAIPAGTYEIIINQSQRFTALEGRSVFLPLLLDVPGFQGVRIHVGNFSGNTSGCVLVGTERRVDMILHSTAAFHALFAKMQARITNGESITIEIVNEPEAPKP